MEPKTYSTTKQLLLSATLPESTRTYKCIPHQQVIDCTLEAIDKAGLVLSSETYSSAKDGKIATGKYTIKSVADNEMQLQIAWLNSYNKTKRLTYGIGAQVFICQNGMVSADMGFFKKKHQGGIQEFTPLAIVEYVKQAEEVFKRLQDEREKMKQVQLTKRVIAELLGRAVVEEEFITTTQLNIVKREMEHPTHDYGAPNTMWEVYNFCSYAMKELHPSLWMGSHLKAHSFFTTEAGIIVPSKQILVMNDGQEVAPNQVTMYEVPGFVPESINDSGTVSSVGIEIDNVIEEEEEPKFGPSDVDYTVVQDNDSKLGTVMLDNDSKLDVTLPATMTEAFEAEHVNEETGEITTDTKTTDYLDLL